MELSVSQTDILTKQAINSTRSCNCTFQLFASCSFLKSYCSSTGIFPRIWRFCQLWPSKWTFSGCFLSLSEVTVHIICTVQPSSIKLVSLCTVPIYCPVSSWHWRMQKIYIWLPLTWVSKSNLEKALVQVTHWDSWRFCDMEDFVATSHSHCSAFWKWWACWPDTLCGQVGKQLHGITRHASAVMASVDPVTWLVKEGCSRPSVYVKQLTSCTMLHDYVF